MKKNYYELYFTEKIYRECGSPVLPVPISVEDMLEVARVDHLSSEVIADSLLKMVKEFPERLFQYERLLVHSCFAAGGETARNGDDQRSNYYLLQAVEYAPESSFFHEHLARSYHRLGSYEEALNHYYFVIKNNRHFDRRLLIFILECLFTLGRIEEVNGLLNLLLEKSKDPEMGYDIVFGMQGVSILSEDNAPEELRAIFKSFFHSLCESRM
ncbi:MAG: hypothetical protein JEZ00_15215 [Anaerolineaceae bacterium]|nr:hypothetical protein [Anaerolineaceae bacterium]